MALSRRYSPSWPPGESAEIGCDFAPLLPPGVGLTGGTLDLVSNTNPPQQQSDFVQDPVIVRHRQAWCRISGGQAGRDYQAVWTVSDSQGHAWSRTALLLCAATG